MSSSPEKNAHDLEDYSGLLEQFQSVGFEYAVIGGCAVGAYARLNQEFVLSGDLDLYASSGTLNGILAWAPRQGMIVRKRPQPRPVPAAFIEWQGLEVDILTRTDGLPEPDRVIRQARLFRLKSREDLEILVADPFDLLRNKLAVHRSKDRPHIAILMRFVEEEVVAAFREESSPRERLAPARQLLSVLNARTLHPNLAARLLPLAKTPADYRFLVDTVPSRKDAERLVERASEDLKPELIHILKHRGRKP